LDSLLQRKSENRKVRTDKWLGAGDWWLKIVTTVVAGLLSTSLFAQSPSGGTLPPWTRGTLDIHQISTGTGNSALIVFPDATTLLVDAGPSGAAIARYIEAALAPGAPRLDYAVLTHFHSDHLGGIADVAARIPVGTLIDRGYDYLKPADNDRTFSRYRAFLDERERKGGSRAEPIRVGRANQIVPRDHAAFPSVEIRNVAANGVAWTGEGDGVLQVFPPLESIADEDRPSENMCSIGLRVRYGKFDFFTGGDMPGVPDAGAPAWQSVETAVAKAIGPTDVHVVNHHGSIDPESPIFLSTLRSRVLILPSWSETHPSQDALKRMLATRLYPGPRDIFATTLHASTKASIGDRATQFKADHGHIVVRVAPGGNSYQVFVLDEATEARRVLAVFGPYASQ
jgi:beta-lactamase superfamily II metal-dependent hydrolase